MKYFTANIDEKNSSMLDDASKKSGVLFKKGIYMTFSENHKKQFSFNPIFCDTKENAIKLLRSYFQIAKQNNFIHNLQNDLYTISKIEINNNK